MLLLLISFAVGSIGLIAYLIGSKLSSNIDFIHAMKTISYTGFVFLFAFLVAATCMRVEDSIQMEELTAQKQMLEYRIEENQGNSDLMLYNDISTFNQKIRKNKRLARNPWTNVFAMQQVYENIELIDINQLGG